MHSFDELVYRSVSFTLNAIEKANNELLKILEHSAPSSAIKNLQMLQLQKAILVTGMFSIFESILQQGLNCRDGFSEVKKILLTKGENDLHDRFQDFICAVNVLKHGKGKSYDFLLAKSNSLPFRIKFPDEHSFSDERDVSEISTYIEVTNEFVLDCASLINKVSETLRKEGSSFYY